MKGFNRRTNLCIYFCPSSRGLIMGVWNSHTSVGNILGSVIAGSFVMTNWGLSFIVPGLIIITGGVICFFFLLPSKYHIYIYNRNRNFCILFVLHEDQEYIRKTF